MPFITHQNELYRRFTIHNHRRIFIFHCVIIFVLIASPTLQSSAFVNPISSPFRKANNAHITQRTRFVILPSLYLFQQQQEEEQNQNHSKDHHLNSGRIQILSSTKSSSTRIRLNGDSNNNLNDIEQEESKQDVDNLFATYMAQRKDKGFMDIKYNIGNTAAPSSASSSNSPPGSADGNSSFTYGNNLGGVGASSPQPSSSSSLAMGSDSTIENTNDEEEGEEIQRKRLGSNLPGIRRLWGGSSNQDNIVQHIPLTSESDSSKKDVSNEENSFNPQDNSIPSTNQNAGSSTKPPNPPSLLEQDLQQIETDYDKFQDQMKNSLEILRNTNPELSIPNDADKILSQVIEEQRINDVQEIKYQRALESLDEYQKNSMKKMIEDAKDFVNGGNNDNDQSTKDQIDSFLYGSRSNSENINISTTKKGIRNDFQTKDPIVKEIVDEVNKEQQYRSKQEEKLREYEKYEETLKKRYKNASSMNTSDNINTNANANTNNLDINEDNFDKMQLEILQDLLQKRQERSSSSNFDDEDLFVTDNIEDGIEELKEQIDNFKDRQDEYKPDSLKEWQMYRAIATKLSNAKKGSSEDDDEEDEYLDLELRTLDQNPKSTSTPFDTISDEDARIAREKVEAWKEFQRKEEEMRKEAGLAIKYRPPFEWSDKPEPTDNDAESQLGSKRLKQPFDRKKAEEAYTELDQLALKVLNDLMEKTSDVVRQQKIRNEIEALKEGMKARQEAIENKTYYPVKKEVIKPIDINSALGRGGKKRNASQTMYSTSSQDIDMESNETENTSNEMISSQDDDNENNIYGEGDRTEDIDAPLDSAFFKELEEEEEIEMKNSYPNDSESSSQQEFENEFKEEDVAFNLGTMEEQKFRSMVARSGVRTKEGQDELKEKWEDFQRAEQLMREKTGLSKGDNNVPEATVETKYNVDNIFKDGDIDADAILGSIGKRPSRKSLDRKPIVTESKDLQENEGVVKENIVEPKKTDIITDVESNVALESKEDNQNLVPNKDEPLSTDQIAPEPTKEQQIRASAERGSLAFGLDNEFLSTSSSFASRKADLLVYPVLSVAQLNTLMGLKRSVYSTGISPYLAKVNKPFQEFGAIFTLEGALVDVTGLQYEAWKRTAQTYDFNVPTIDEVRYASVHAEEYAVQKIFFWTDNVFVMKKVVDFFKDARSEIFEEFIKDKNHDAMPMSSSPLQTNKSPDSSSKIPDMERDVVNIQLAAWHRTAREYGFQPPSVELLNLVGSLKPDEIVRSVFKWSNDYMLSNNVATSYRKYLKEETSTWMKRESQLSSSNTPTANDTVLNAEEKSNNVKTTAGPSMDEYLGLKLRTWETVAQKYNRNAPTFDQINVAEFAGPEKAVKSLFHWTTDEDECAAIVSSYREVLKTMTQEWVSKHKGQTTSSSSIIEEEILDIPLVELREGADEWLNSIQDVFVPSVVISNFEEELSSRILEEVGLSSFFPLENRISSSSIYKTDTQRMLGAALRAERRPDHCVVFSATPQSAFSAHEVEMKNIALVSPYPYYELTSADMTVRDFKSIGMINLKNVFSETSTEEPMQQIQVESPRIQRKTLLKTRFWDD